MMIKTDPMIAVRDVVKSSQWYQELFDCKSIHGGDAFDILVGDNEEVILCLHKWGEHEHPTMINQALTTGNGFLLYFRTSNMETIRANAEKHGIIIEAEVALNPNSNVREFSVKDLDGYYLTIAEYHTYGA